MSDAMAELVEGMHWCDVRLVGFAWIEHDVSVVLTLRFLPDERTAYLLCRWARLVNIDLEFGEQNGGSPFTWEGSVKRDEQGTWRLAFDFASVGVLSLQCSELEFLLAPPSDADSDPVPQRWLVSWIFHLHTKAEKDAERVFAKVARRVATTVRVTGSGLRRARPGTWVRAELELVGTFGDALAVTLDEAGKFGSHFCVGGPQHYADGSTLFRGRIDARSHCELAAADFELRNVLPASSANLDPSAPTE